MLTNEVRQLALTGDGGAIRKIAHELTQLSEPDELMVDMCKLVADLTESDFEASSIKCELIGYKYATSERFDEVTQILNCALAHIAFAHGNFDQLEDIVDQETSLFKANKSRLNIRDIFQLLRLKAGKHYILNEFNELRTLVSKLPNYSLGEGREHAYYFINAIKCLSLSERGEHLAALKATKINLDLAKTYKYSSLLAPFDVMYVRADSLFSMSEESSGKEAFLDVREKAKESSQWPWYFKADGQIARQAAFNGEISESLALIREERELNSSFKFVNGLAFLPDANELFIRFVMKDIERIEVLLDRLPELSLVKQVRAAKHEWNGREILPYIENLPFETPREKLYKLFALAEYFRDNESLAVKHMQDALKIVEETGAIEFLLRQNELIDVIIKAVDISPTPFLEDMVRRLTERIRIIRSNKSGLLPQPLTKRELEILRHLATNETVKDIGSILNVSMNTMKTHVKNIYKKLKVDSRTKAIEKAKELFLI